MRLFIALDLPSEHKRLLSALRRSLVGVTWYPPQTYHLTLRFIGDVRSRPMMEEIDHALAAIAVDPFEFAPNTVGVDELGPRPRLWAGIAPSPGLVTLQGRIEAALRRCGIAPEKRRFQPRIALGSTSGEAGIDIVRWIQAHNLLRGKPVIMERFTLFRSHRTPDAPHYEACAEYPLDAVTLDSMESW